MRVDRLLLTAVTAAVICTTVSAPAGLASTPTARHLHESDSGRTIHVRRGDVITVRLPGGSMGGYHRPRSSDRTAVRRTFASGGYPSAADARARFVARRVGTADLTSVTDFTCLHTNPRCVPPQREWSVHVVVG